MAKQKFDDTPTPEQARLEEKMMQESPAGSLPIGSEFEKLERQFQDEEAKARLTAQELIDKAEQAQEKAAAARAKIMELNASEEARYTYVLYSRYDFQTAIKVDNSKRRLTLAFVHNTMVVNRPLMKTIKDNFGFDLTVEQLIDLLRGHPGFNRDFVVGSGPGVKLSDDQKTFVRHVVARAREKGLGVVIGPKATNSGRA